jgi:uncharacterized membrane-anchored protein YjiN (DUF445 family)
MSRAPALIVRAPNGHGARRMRIVATGLLLLMAAVFLAARHLEGVHAGWGFVRAFAEAAMVGGLADWFAVTALFRHPLGLPIPHTAIIPRNKDRIGDTLAAFLKDNFLIPRVVARRMQQVDVAGAAGRFLASPSEAEGRTRETASRLVADIMEALDQERLGGMVKSVIDTRLRNADLAPMLGQALQAAIAKDRHLPLIDGMIRWAGKTLEGNEHLIRQMVHDRAGSILRWTGLDETLADKIIDGLLKLLDDMSIDPGHPVRMKAEDALARLAEDLQFDEVMQRRVAEWRDEVLDNEAMRRWLDGLWEQGRSALLRAARNPRGALGGKFGETLRQLGETLQTDARLRTTINRFARRAAVGFSARYGESIVKLVSETVRGWDTRTITTRLEDAVGRDLQYIRVNGTIVGGLVGLTIHAVEVWL